MLSATMNTHSLNLTAFSETATKMWFNNRLDQLDVLCSVLVCLNAGIR